MQLLKKNFTGELYYPVAMTQKATPAIINSLINEKMSNFNYVHLSHQEEIEHLF